MGQKFVSGAYRPDEDQTRRPQDVAAAIRNVKTSGKLRVKARGKRWGRYNVLATPESIALSKRIVGERDE